MESPQSIAEFFQTHQRGAFLAEASEALARVCEAVIETSNAGTVTIQLSVKHLGGDQLAIDHKITGKPPHPVYNASIFFYDKKKRGLSRRDPNQGEIPGIPRLEDRREAV